ncbi:hypothetical protein ACQR1V_29950 [Bradyrhizobium oligotrophicum]|nr:hypothetical protein [Bradyrhizobium sp. SZCCHNR3003]
MSPIVITIARGSLIVVFLAAFFTAMWADWRMMKRMLGSGYSIFNPMSAFAAWKSLYFPLFLASILVAAGAGVALKALE